LIVALLNYNFNRYFTEIVVDKDGDIEKANRTVERASYSNELQLMIETNRLLTKKISWIPLVEISVPDFPILSEIELRSLTAGVYQIKLAPSYMARILPSNTDKEDEPSPAFFR